MSSSRVKVADRRFDRKMCIRDRQGTVGLAEHLGSDTFLKVEVPGVGTLTVRGGGEVGLHHGDTVRLAPQPDKLHRFGANGLAMQ